MPYPSPNPFESLLRETDPIQVWTRFADAINAYGFAGVVYAHYKIAMAPSVRIFGEPQYTLRQATPELEKLLIEEQGRPNWLIRWAADHTGALSWSAVGDAARRGELTQAEAETRDSWRAQGLRAGYVLSFHSPVARIRGVVFLMASSDQDQATVDRNWAERGDSIHALCELAHLRLSNMAPVSTAPNVLSRRQREVLEWIAVGKTAADVALILGLQRPTVEKHLRLAREALNADTTAQAIMNASLLNLIFVEQDP